MSVRDIKRLSELLLRSPHLIQIHRPVHPANSSIEVMMRMDWAVILFDYSGQGIIDGVPYAVRPGLAAILPPGTHRVFQFTVDSTHRVANFRLGEAGATMPKPVVLDTGDLFVALREQFDDALGIFALQPERAEVKLWDLLWTLTDCPLAQGRTRDSQHRALRQAVRNIERWLGEPFTVGHLADTVGLSHNHLTRLFRKEYGTTPLVYIRTRRMKLARYLLVHSTIPIKVVGTRVGIPDPHLFNKTVRREFGCSPTVLRETGGQTEFAAVPVAHRRR